MPPRVTLQPLILTDDDRRYLTQLTRSRTAQHTQVIRAHFLPIATGNPCKP
jgi:hypothetical protein